MLDHFLPCFSGFPFFGCLLFHPGNRFVFKVLACLVPSNFCDTLPTCKWPSLRCKFIYLLLKNKWLLFRQFPTINKTLYFCIVLFINFFLNKIVLLWSLFVFFLIVPLVFKGLVHTKMKILLLIYCPHVIPIPFVPLTKSMIF